MLKKGFFVCLILILLAGCTPKKPGDSGAATPVPTQETRETTEPVIGADDSQKEDLVVGIPKSTSGLPFLYIEKMGLMKDVSLKTELFVNPTKAFLALQRGERDYLLTGTSVGWNNYLQGGPVRIINTGIWGVSYMLAKDDSIKTVKDLRRKKIVVPFPGSPLHYQTNYILKANGLDVDNFDLEIMFGTYSQSVPLILLGRADCAPYPEPLATMLVETKGLKRIFDYKELWGDVNDGDKASPQVSLIGLESFLKNNIRHSRALVEAWKEATNAIVEKPAEAAALFAETLEFSEEILTEAIGNTYYWIPEPEKNKELLTSYYEAVSPQEAEKELPPIEDFFFTLD